MLLSAISELPKVPMSDKFLDINKLLSLLSPQLFRIYLMLIHGAVPDSQIVIIFRDIHQMIDRVRNSDYRISRMILPDVVELPQPAIHKPLVTPLDCISR